MSKITVTTIAGATSGSDANKVKIESGDTLQVDSNATVGGTLAVTGDATFDTSVLKVDAANNRVGVGTASPSSDLHVSGGAGAHVAIQSSAGSHWRLGDAVGSSNGIFVVRDHTNSANRIQILADGKTQIAQGVTFGSDTAAANTLDDYEEGSFVPILKHEVGDALTVGYASGFTHGRYTKIGTLVIFQLTIDVDSVSGGASNQQLVVPNLPFTSKTYQTNSNGGANMTYIVNLNTNITYGIVLGNSTTLRFYSAPATPSYGNTVTSSTHIQCYGQYETAS